MPFYVLLSLRAISHPLIPRSFHIKEGKGLDFPMSWDEYVEGRSSKAQRGSVITIKGDTSPFPIH